MLMARRSVLYNGVDNRSTIHHTDLRHLAVGATHTDREDRASGSAAAGKPVNLTSAEIHRAAEEEPAAHAENIATGTKLRSELAGQCNLVTGTPPYFSVDFDEEKGGEASTGYGALPSCRQSAPARYKNKECACKNHPN
jgi:hypothetical protein